MAKKYNINAGSDLSKAGRIEHETPEQFPLAKNNFVFMGISALLIVVGFLLMLGGSSTTEAFNPDIFSFRRVILGPTVAFLGFIALGISLIIPPKDDNDASRNIKE